jgi:hypothetical protein
VRNKRLTLLLVIAAGAVAAAFVPLPEQTDPQADTDLLPAPRAAGSVPHSGRLSGLPERETIGEPGGELFASRTWAPPRASRPKVETVTGAPATTTPPPPLPYRVAGRVAYGEEAHVVLARGETVLTVREGDMLDGGYRVESIAADRVTLRYTLLDLRHDLAIAATLPLEAPQAQLAASPPAAASRPAQLRWEGPKQVRAGDPFNVALKITSVHPLRASPLQLGYDAKLLEPLDVRAGGFFAGGMFSYRVNPGGAIFVGASGKGAVPADAELLVITFKPIRPGATAELTLSSLILQGASGRTIAHDRPAAFRTAIVR